MGRQEPGSELWAWRETKGLNRTEREMQTEAESRRSRLHRSQICPCNPISCQSDPGLHPVRDQILPLPSASHSLLRLSLSALLSCRLSYICMHTLSFCKHNLDFSKHWHGNKEKLRRACSLNIDSSFSHHPWRFSRCFVLRCLFARLSYVFPNFNNSVLTGN